MHDQGVGLRADAGLLADATGRDYARYDGAIRSALVAGSASATGIVHAATRANPWA